MAKQKISAKAAVADIKSGMGNGDLMKKYGLSARGLEILFQKLIENHLVTDSEVSAIGQASARSIRPENQQAPAEPPRATNQVIEVAKQQKRLLWLILLGVLVGILLSQKTNPTTTGPSEFTEAWAALHSLASLASLTLAVICAYFVYKIGRAIEISTLRLVITIILMFVPLISLGALLYMNSKATTFLQAAGVHVGLMGAKTIGEKTTRSFKQQASSASWIIPLITIGLMAVSNSAIRNSEFPISVLIVGGFFVLLLLAGFVLGVVGCFGMKSHGAKTTLVPGLIGAGLNATILAVLICIAVVTFLKVSGNAMTDPNKGLHRYANQVNSNLPKMVGSLNTLAQPQEFRSETGNFSVMSPLSLKEQAKPVDTPIGRIDVHLFVAAQGGTAYMVAYSDYPQSYVQEHDPEEILDGGRDGAVKNSNGKLVSETKITIDNNPGREIVIDTAQKHGQDAGVKARVFLARNRLYQVLVVAPTTELNKPAVDDFLRSLKLLSK